MQETQTTPKRSKKIASNGVIAMIMFVGCEVMFFMALISAYLIVSRGQLNWPPLDQPRLPVEMTAINSIFLMLSGYLMFISNRKFISKQKEKATSYLFYAVLCATFFVIVQGWEWMNLIFNGLTMFSSTYGSFFYLVIGSHALHAFAAIIMMIYIYIQMRAGKASSSAFNTSQVFWYFVVGIWPVLYITVYLN
jgi:cytochrome c oxidase subunit III